MLTAVTDHVFVDEGHTLDFTNKAFEAVALVGDDVGADRAADARPPDRAVVAQRGERRVASSARPRRARARARTAQLDAALDAGTRASRRASPTSPASRGSSSTDDPEVVVDALLDALRAGAAEEQIGQALAYAAALRITRFHTQNDFGDWDTVHHSFTTANALHHALAAVAVARAAARRGARRAARLPRPVPQRARGRGCPTPSTATSPTSRACWEVQGEVDTAGNIVYGYLRERRRPRASSSRRSARRSLAEDVGFHWYQVFEAAVRQSATLAGALRGGSAHPRRLRAVPRRAHAHPA